MAKKVKVIQVSILKGRFTKLRDAASFAEDIGRAIAFLGDGLNRFDLSEEQSKIIDRLKVEVEEWCNKFVRLAEQMQDVESKYWDCLTEDKTMCALIEKVPTYRKSDVPDIFQMVEDLFYVGYYSIYGSPVQNLQFSKKNILLNIKGLRSKISLYLKALANANYNGVWEPVAQTIVDISDFEPAGIISSLLKSFAIKDN